VRAQLVEGLAVFALLQMVPAASLDATRVYPNPFRPSVNSQGITFDGLTASARIKIFNIAGELVRQLTDTAGTGVVRWDGSNESGSMLASGTYIAYVEGAAGTKKIKFALIR